MEEQRQGTGGTAIPNPFARQSSSGTSTPTNEGGHGHYSPKKRFRLSHLGRPRSQEASSRPPLENGTQDSETPSQPRRARARTQRFPILTRSHTTQPGSSTSDRSNRTEDTRRHRQGSSRTHRRKEPPKRFLFCFPWVKSKTARGLVLRCFVSGIFLILMLTIYLSLSITSHINTSEFSILLILLILLTTVFFCHGLIMLCVQLVRTRNGSASDVESNKYGHPGYAIPAQPIRVVLARDEEAAGIESDTTKFQPPAYGLWRESVRVDPNRIYWQRAPSPPPGSMLTSASPSDNSDDNPRTAQRRPPSYASEDGIDYVVDARPRSIAPPPSSVYSQNSTPAMSNTPEMPPLPHPAVLRGP
ncbi:hypothetical protein F4808DRAFT_454889 [Astrocystis sublimbata]|nr:hypothetical protein F4808DRAFT_454889 [Astrocystis sublimbata]